MRAASDRLVVLHIGLPKTGTTFLQKHVFQAAPLTFAHRLRTPEWAGLCADLRGYARGHALLAPYRRHRVAQALRAAAPEEPGTLLVSDENISLGAHALWVGGGPSPETVAARLGVLAPKVAALGQLRVLIGVRRQDQWLAARYAQSAERHSEFNQVDFDRRMAWIHGERTLTGAWRWADFGAVERAFTDVLGAENVMLLSQERMARDLPGLKADLSRFLGIPGRLNRGGKRKRTNTLSAGENAWRLRGRAEVLELRPDVQDMILERFGPLNTELAARLPLGF